MKNFYRGWRLEFFKTDSFSLSFEHTVCACYIFEFGFFGVSYLSEECR